MRHLPNSKADISKFNSNIDELLKDIKSAQDKIRELESKAEDFPKKVAELQEKRKKLEDEDARKVKIFEGTAKVYFDLLYVLIDTYSSWKSHPSCMGQKV